MANSADFQNLNYDVNSAVTSLARKEISGVLVSTIFNSAIILALMAGYSNQKSDELIGAGDPDTRLILSGTDLPETKLREIEECNAFTLEEFAVGQADSQDQAYRGANPVMATGTPGAMAFTVTVVDGAITAATPSGPTGTDNINFAGSAPTLYAVDMAGHIGHGAVLTAVVSGGSITSVNVASGGFGYTNGSVTVVVWAGASEGERYRRPLWKWYESKADALLYDRDIEAKLDVNRNDNKYFGDAVSTLFQSAMKSKIASEAQKLNYLFLTGNPTNQDAAIWSQPAGILSAVDDGRRTANYAGVDRTIANNFYMASPTDTTAHQWGAQELVSDMLVGKGLGFKGANIDVFLCDVAFFMKIQAEANSRNLRINPGGIVEKLAKWGFHIQAVEYGSTTFVPIAEMPRGTGVGLNLKSWVVAFKKGKKFTPSKYYDLNGGTATIAGTPGGRFYIDTQVMPMCWAPPLNVKYTNLS